MSTAISNPNAAYRTVTDYRTGKDATGGPLEMGQIVHSYRADAAVTRGQVLAFVPPTATVPVSVTPMTAAAADFIFAGVALESGAAGEQIRLCVQGHCLCNVGAQTAVAAQYIVAPQTATGAFDVDDVPDAGDTVIGVLWGVKDANNLAFAYIDASGLALNWSA